MVELYSCPDVVEWFTGKDRVPEYHVLDDDILDDFENYGIKEKGIDRFVQYFYGLLPSHNRELYEKYYEKIYTINRNRQRLMKQFLRDEPFNKKYEPTEEDLVFDPNSVIKKLKDNDLEYDDSPAQSIVASYMDTAVMFKRWSKYKQVYRFHPTMADQLAETNLDGFYPEVLDNLPFKCFYIDITNLQYYYNEDLMLGCMVHVIKDSNAIKNGKKITQYLIHLDFFMHPTAFCWCRFVYYTDSKTPLKDGFSKGSVIDDMGEYIPGFIVNAIAYIASHNADCVKDLSNKSHKHNKTGKFNPRKLLLENSITNWNTGYVIGPKIEKALERYENEKDGTHASPRPHIRGAHWHHYWTGPKSGKQTLIVHWINETLVNCESEDEIPITERRNRKM